MFGKTINVEYASYYVPAPGTPPIQTRGRGPPSHDNYGPPRGGRERDSGPPGGGGQGYSSSSCFNNTNSCL